MIITSLNLSDIVLFLGMASFLVGLACLMLWLPISRKPYVIRVSEIYLRSQRIGMKNERRYG